MSDILRNQLDYIYFFYGLAFILFATVCLTLQRNNGKRLPWIWLGLFGLTHGLAEWSDLVAIGLGDSFEYRLFRLFLVASSFICLMEFGRRGMNRMTGRHIGLWIYVPASLVALAGALWGLSGVIATARYGFAIPGGILAALALFLAARSAPQAASIQRLAAITLVGYVLTAGLVVPKAPFFPAAVINQTAFDSAFGVPVQLLRGILAIMATALVWTYYQRTRPFLEFDQVRRRRAGGLKLTVIFVTILAAGWAFTEMFTRSQEGIIKADLAHQAAIAAEAVKDHSASIGTEATPATSYADPVERHLLDIQEANPQIRGLCILTLGEGGEIRTLVSSGSPFGLLPAQEHSVEASVSLRQALTEVMESGEARALGPYREASGDYLSSFAPVRDQVNGETIAVIGIDFDGEAFEQMISTYRLLPIGITLLISLIAIAVYVTRQSLLERAEILESAKKRFSMLTHRAIMDRHWEVGFEDNFIPTCWEVKDCPKTDCPVYGKEHARCWLIAGTFCRGRVQGRFAQKLGDCSECEVYLMALSHGPVSEIGENFNNLMWSLREKEEMLAAANDELEERNLELVELHRIAEDRADSDSLTGLRNHGHFQEHLHEEVDRARRYGRPLSLVMIDLDNFKNLNDRYGHQLGDAVLKRVGGVLLSGIREADYAARYGGEEFVVIMPEVVGSQAVEAAERLRMKVESVYESVDLPPSLTSASFGVADLPVCAEDGRSLIAAADAALLTAKRAGRNRVVYYRDISPGSQAMPLAQP
ncbi:MAG: diguanylate cyclase [Pseudomonadota bacterium]